MIKDIIEANEIVKPNSFEYTKLKECFPQYFDKDGTFNFDKFKTTLTHDNVEFSKENYSLNFLGKQYARLQAGLDAETVITPDIEHNSKEENKNSQNVYVKGDNIEALRHMLKSYTNKIKMIYIDPPYNTGSDGFVYPDKYEFSKDELVNRIGLDEEEAERILNLKGKSTHSAWLTFMMPRLMLARELLTEDGIIFISIDDNEVHNLRMLCNEVFGEENLLACISRATGTPTGGGFDGFVNEMDYILVYSKNVNATIVQKLKMSTSDTEIYNEVDKNGNRYLLRTLRRTGGEDRREDRPTMFYPLIAPDGTEVFPFGPTGYESRWRCSLSGAKTLEENGLLEWKQNVKDGVITWHPYKKFYLNHSKKAGNIWKDIFNDHDENLGLELWDNIEGNKKATRDIRTLFDNKKVFETAKPVELIEKTLLLGSGEQDIIMDFFGGSSTLAHAIMRSNANLKNHRKYIIVQLEEPTKPNSEADKARYKYITDIGIERIKRASIKIKEETNADIDYGFKIFKLNEVEQKTLDKCTSFSNIKETSMLSDDYIKSFAFDNSSGVDTILQTWKMQDGLGFDTSYEVIKIGDYNTYLSGNTIYLIDSLTLLDTQKLCEKLVGYKQVNSIVVYGYSVSMTKMQELDVNIKNNCLDRKLSISKRF